MAGDLGQARASGALMRLSLFGGCEIAGPDGQPVQLASRKARAVLAVLALSDGMALGRDRLCGLLWAEAAEDQARASLRQCLKLIRQALGPAADPVLRADRLTMALDRAGVDLDVTRLTDRLAGGDLADPLLLRPMLHESLLAGFDGIDPGFDAWLAVLRETLRRRVQTVLETAMAPGQPADRQEQAALALLALDPAHEPALRGLMALRMARGDRAGALREFETFRTRLMADYDAEPDAETTALYAALKNEATRPLQAPAIAPAAPVTEGSVTVIAVVEEPSGDSAADAACRSFGLSLRGMLARFRHWTVIAAMPGSDPVLPAGGHVLRLTPLPSGEALSLSVVLSGAGPQGATIWTQVADITTARTMASQETVLRGICGALDVYLSQARLSQLRLREPHSLNALEKWMRGQQLMDQWDPMADSRAETMFLEAIHAWPDHPTLLANLADLYNSRHLIYPGIHRKPELERKAMQLARRAVALDPLDPRCHVTLGWSLAMAGRFEQAGHSFLRGHELNPADPAIAMSAAHGMGVLDRMDEATALCKAAFDCHPSPPWTFWGFDSNLRFLARDYTGAVASADRSGEVKTNILGWKCAALGMLGDPRGAEDAQDFLIRIREAWVPDTPPTDAEAVAWFVNIFPFARPAQRAHLCEGLSRAGLPVNLVALR
ncbi:MAG: hypothetical protein LPK12_03075 [Rhodobacterales bacterium]|nr:hypothetical protein [Rhodobacterales bacterium]MDX5498914.1 hypothetical protein [Rhodobacterales bacterium]